MLYVLSLSYFSHDLLAIAHMLLVPFFLLSSISLHFLSLYLLSYFYSYPIYIFLFLYLLYFFFLFSFLDA